MFVTVALITLGIVALLALRDWTYHPRFSIKSVQKSLKKISLAISLQEWDTAEKELSLLLTTGKGGKETLLCYIQVLRGTGRFIEALHQAELNGRLYPEELLFRLEEGKILLDLMRPQEALEALQVCAPILRNESDLCCLASALLQAGFPQQGYDILNPLLEGSQSGHVAAIAADACYELKQFQEAITLYGQALDRGYKSHHVFVQLGHAFRRLGNLAQAENIFRTLLDQDAGDAAATLGIGACLQERGAYTKAFLIYQTALAWGRDVRLVHKAAYAALRAKKFRLAEAYFLEVLQKQEPDPLTLAYYGLSLECQKKWQEAEQAYLKLIQLFPSYPQGFRALAWMFGVGLSQTLSQEQGLNFAHRALKLKNDPLSWEILSAAAARSGDFDKAYQIQLSLSKQDKDPQARARRQQALRSLRKKTPLDDHHVVRSLVA